MSAHLESQAQQLAAQFPPLLLEAERVASTVYQGVHGRRRAGQGESFWQFRHYEAGDSAASIDWRQSARTDRLFIREREWEATQTLYLWADISGSMRYSSSRNLPHKAERARLLMLALASLALRGGETAVWLDGQRRTTVQGRNGLERITARMGDLAASPASNLQPPPASLPLSRHAHLVLCSDFLMPPERLESLMQGYASQNLKGALVHVLDPAENDFGFEGRVEMQGLEGETPLKLPNAAALREAYTERLEAHKARLEFLARSAGWLYARHITSSSPHLVLMQLWQGLGAGI